MDEGSPAHRNEFVNPEDEDDSEGGAIVRGAFKLHFIWGRAMEEIYVADL